MKHNGKPVRFIPLTCGRVAMVDAEDFGELSEYSWHLNEEINSEYARGCTEYGDRVYMSRAIMGAPDDMEVDYLDGVTLNLTKDNLEICTHQENADNKRRRQSGQILIKNDPKRFREQGRKVIKGFGSILS